MILVSFFRFPPLSAVSLPPLVPHSADGFRLGFFWLCFFFIFMKSSQKQLHVITVNSTLSLKLKRLDYL